MVRWSQVVNGRHCRELGLIDCSYNNLSWAARRYLDPQQGTARKPRAVDTPKSASLRLVQLALTGSRPGRGKQHGLL